MASTAAACAGMRVESAGMSMAWPSVLGMDSMGAMRMVGMRRMALAMPPGREL